MARRRDGRMAPRGDADAELVRRTGRSVALWITIAASVLVVAVLVAAFMFVFSRIPVAHLFDRQVHEETVDVDGIDVLLGGVVIGGVAIVLAGTLGLLATQRAVAPLVDALARQRRFVADASHELRTPLAILDARLQVLDRALPHDDPNRATVTALRADSRNLIAVVTDMLDAVDMTPPSRTQRVEAAGVVIEAVSSLQLFAQERDVRITTAPSPEEVWVGVPEASLQRALVALLDNAVKHSPAGGEVTVALTAARSDAVIEVIDHGAGIRGIDPDRVFDRFARSSESVDGGGSARTGFGIGLALVQDTMGRYGGSVHVVATGPDGTTIAMRMPRQRRPA